VGQDLTDFTLMAWNNKVMNAVILPVGFSDHHLVLFDLNMKAITEPNYFWHFNVKLLEDALFCDGFKLFWNKWKMQKDSFENMCQ